MVTIAVTAEAADEPRVAVSPETVKKLVALGAKVKVEAGAGARSRFSDETLRAQGAEIAPTAADALRDADILLKVRRPAAADLAGLKPGALVIAMLDPYGDRTALQALAASNASLFTMEFMPRITRAQSMDVLSSQANLAGYKVNVAETKAEYVAQPTIERRLIFEKALSPNDIGATGSHQAAIVVPPQWASRIADLEESGFNPSADIEVQSVALGMTWTWRLIHYNGRETGQSTRDEYRLTNVGAFLRLADPLPGHRIQLWRTDSGVEVELS